MKKSTLNKMVIWHNSLKYNKQKKYMIRRCKNIHDPYLQCSYIDFLNKIDIKVEDTKKNNYLLIMCVLSHIKNYNSADEFYTIKNTFAKEMAKLKSNSPIINIKKFNRLISCTDEDKLFYEIITILKYIDYFDVREFCKDLFYWNSLRKNIIRKKWAETYYNSLPSELLEKFQ